MSAQKLVSIITCPWLDPGSSIQVPHGLRSAARPVVPRSVMPEKATSIIVSSVDDTYVHFFNAGSNSDEVRFKAEAGLSLEWGPADEPPFLWQGAFGDGTGTVQYIETGDGLQGGPITGAGTIAMRPLTPSPAGTYGSATAIPVVTVNNKGQVTSVSTRAVSGSSLTLGTTAGTACEGNDARLSNQRVPTDGSVTDAKVATANKDGLQSTPSMRTIGTTAYQACAGNDGRLTPAPVLGATLLPASGSFSQTETKKYLYFYVNPLSVNVALTANRLQIIEFSINGVVEQTPEYYGAGATVDVKNLWIGLETLNTTTGVWDRLFTRALTLPKEGRVGFPPMFHTYINSSPSRIQFDNIRVVMEIVQPYAWLSNVGITYEVSDNYSRLNWTMR